MIRRFVAIAVVAAIPHLASAEMYQSYSGRLRFFPGAGAETAAEVLAGTADQDRDQAARELGRDYDGVTDVRVARDVVSFAALQPPGGLAPPWASGVAYPTLNLIVIRVDAHEQNPRALLRHELSHVAVGRLTAGRAPRWLLEGLAVVHSGNAWNEEGPSLVQAALANSLFSFDLLKDTFPAGPTDAELAYAESASFVKYLIDRNGEDKLDDVLREMVKGTGFDDASLRVLGATPHQLESAWRTSLSKWDLVLRFVTNRNLFWWGTALLCALGGAAAIRRRRAGMLAMEREEEVKSTRELLRAHAIWADRPTDPIEDTSDEPGDTSPSSLDEADDLPEYLMTHESTPKKPTIH